MFHKNYSCAARFTANKKVHSFKPIQACANTQTAGQTHSRDKCEWNQADSECVGVRSRTGPAAPSPAL